MQQTFGLWISPEIERRKQLGLLPEEFELYGAQVIFNVDGDAPIVRLNEEVRARMRFRASRAIAKGEVVRSSDIEDILSVELTDQDPDAAHITLIRHGDGWAFTFDGRYNAGRIAEITNSAKEFLASAEFAVDRGYQRAAVDNLFSAAELMAKGILLKLPVPDLLSSRRHGYIASTFNWWGHLGNTDPRYVELLNELSRSRAPARYPPRAFSVSPDETKRWLTMAKEMFQALEAESPPARRLPQ